MRGLRIVRSLLPSALLSMAPCVFAIDLTGTVANPVSADVSVASVQPADVELPQGGAAVKAVIRGHNLDGADLQGEVLKAGRLYRGVSVLLERPLGKESRQMELKALPTAEPGPYTVRLKVGARTIDLPLRVQVILPSPGRIALSTAAKATATAPPVKALEKPATVGPTAVVQGLQRTSTVSVSKAAATPTAEAGKTVAASRIATRPTATAPAVRAVEETAVITLPTIAPRSQQTGKAPVAKAVVSPGTGYNQLFPNLKVQTGTKEFEDYGPAWVINAPATVTFRWVHHSPEVKGGQWEVRRVSQRVDQGTIRRGDLVVARGNAGIAPPPGEVRNFNIDFAQFLNLPAPNTGAKYRVRIRGTKITRFTGAVEETNFATPSSNGVEITYVTAEPPSEFTDEALLGDKDEDRDGFADDVENKLAEDFRPYLIFDADESDRGPGEPKLIYQVQCVDAETPRSCNAARIVYYLLFARDGGWQSCSPWCDNAHNGDNHKFMLDVAYHRAEKNNPYAYWYMPSFFGERFQGTHPVQYIAAGKHHNYLSTAANHVQGAWGCCDDVAGDGDHILPDAKTGNVYHNVGERGAQLINGLGIVGFPSECAWCDRLFKGGLGDDGANTDLFEWW